MGGQHRRFRQCPEPRVASNRGHNSNRLARDPSLQLRHQPNHMRRSGMRPQRVSIAPFFDDDERIVTI